MDMKIIETSDIAKDGKTITYRLDNMDEPIAAKETTTSEVQSDMEKWTKARSLG